MSIVRTVALGEEITFEVEFLDDDGLALDLAAAPKYKIFDHENSLITTGTGVQDVGAPERWYINTVIPNNAPAVDDPSSAYKIMWLGVDAEGTKYRNTEKFQVFSSQDSGNIPYEPIFLLVGDTEINDNISVDEELASYKIKIIDPVDDSVLLTLQENSPQYSSYANAEYQYEVSIDISNIGVVVPGILARQIHWELVFVSGKKLREIHDYYTVTPSLMWYVNQTRLRLDKAQLWELSASLRLYDWEIIAHTANALDEINAMPATQTGWSLIAVPDEIRPYLLNLTCIHTLRSMYMAEGLSAFDFSGQSTQLSSDRTQYIQTMMDMFGYTEMEEKIRKVKKRIVRASAGVTNLNVGPSTVYPALHNSLLYLRGRLLAASPRF